MTTGHDDLQHGKPAFKDHRQGLAAVALRLAGATYLEVAEALGFASPDSARMAVESELANQAINSDRREFLRAEEATRLERLLRSVWGKALDADHPEHLAAAKVALSIIDRHMRLLGLEAPQQINVYNPTQLEIDAWVAQMIDQGTADLGALERDVIEAVAIEAAPV